MTSKSHVDEVVPSWDGRPESWEDFETDVGLYVDGTPERDRQVCGPRVARRLTGRARTALLSMSPEDRTMLRSSTGCQHLLSFLRQSIGGAPSVDVGKFVERFFFNVKRDTSFL